MRGHSIAARIVEEWDRGWRLVCTTDSSRTLVAFVPTHWMYAPTTQAKLPDGRNRCTPPKFIQHNVGLPEFKTVASQHVRATTYEGAANKAMTLLGMNAGAGVHHWVSLSDLLRKRQLHWDLPLLPVISGPGCGNPTASVHYYSDASRGAGCRSKGLVCTVLGTVCKVVWYFEPQVVVIAVKLYWGIHDQKQEVTAFSIATRMGP